MDVDKVTVAILILARVQPLISGIVHVDLSQRTTKVLIDQSKMAVDSFVSFLNRRKQHTNLKLNYYLFKIKKKFPRSKIALLKLLAISQFKSQLRLHKSVTDTQSRLNCL